MNAMIRYSDRLGLISQGQFQAALDHFSLGRLRAATPITRGMFGQNVFLSTSEGEFVLRGAPHSDDQLAREAFFCRQLHERTTLPAPWPYLIDDTAAIF